MDILYITDNSNESVAKKLKKQNVVIGLEKLLWSEESLPDLNDFDLTILKADAFLNKEDLGEYLTYFYRHEENGLNKVISHIRHYMNMDCPIAILGNDNYLLLIDDGLSEENICSSEILDLFLDLSPISLNRVKLIKPGAITNLFPKINTPISYAINAISKTDAWFSVKNSSTKVKPLTCISNNQKLTNSFLVDCIQNDLPIRKSKKDNKLYFGLYNTFESCRSEDDFCTDLLSLITTGEYNIEKHKYLVTIKEDEAIYINDCHFMDKEDKGKNGESLRYGFLRYLIENGEITKDIHELHFYDEGKRIGEMVGSLNNRLWDKFNITQKTDYLIINPEPRQGRYVFHESVKAIKPIN